MGLRKSKYEIRDGVRIYPDGREVCLDDTKGGRIEYLRRIGAMCARQNNRCAICSEYLWIATFDHGRARGMGAANRDDRIEVDGHPQNAALCMKCNTKKGSVRYHWLNDQYVPRKEAA